MTVIRTERILLQSFALGLYSPGNIKNNYSKNLLLMDAAIVDAIARGGQISQLPQRDVTDGLC